MMYMYMYTILLINFESIHSSQRHDQKTSLHSHKHQTDHVLEWVLDPYSGFVIHQTERESNSEQSAFIYSAFYFKMEGSYMLKISLMELLKVALFRLGMQLV